MRVYHDFFWYPDPDQRFLIRIRANDTDPDFSTECIDKYSVIYRSLLHYSCKYRNNIVYKYI